MPRHISFSRKFPATHPSKGNPTYFVEGILSQLGIDHLSYDYFMYLVNLNPDIDEVFLNKFIDSLFLGVREKSHTIRAHKKPIKPGDIIIPVCWAGKPYNKTPEGYWQIKFAPDIKIKKVFDITFVQKDELLSIGDKNFYPYGYEETIEKLAYNDLLTDAEFKAWFQKPFTGTIICWNDKIDYL